ncbi:hypothetical protein ACWELQ_20875, partial [Nocardia sp. NPDC004722]
MNVEALQSSWRLVERVGDEAVQYFYAHLFLAHPEVREMFPIRMTGQREKFFAALGRIVSNVETLAADPEFVAQLGRDLPAMRVGSDDRNDSQDPVLREK